MKEAEAKQQLVDLLVATTQQGASDLHISVGHPPMMRLNGALVPLKKEGIVTPEIAEMLVSALLNPEQKEIFLRDKQLDFAYPLEDKARFRVGVFFQQGTMAAALRLIPNTIPNIEQLNLPSVIHNFSRLSQGFVLVVGPSGQGKSTTLASIIDEINHQRNEHILTIEDPIEYLYKQDRSAIVQREIGSDAVSFNTALKAALRQDPDVIMTSDMRDPESIATALTAAETGHLVLSTLHTNSASQTIDRIIDVFPAAQQAQIASQLASTLAAIVSQRLIPSVNGVLIPACEVLITNSAVRNLIREKKSYQIDLVIETGLQDGMISLNRSLISLIKKKMITLETAEIYSTNPEELRAQIGRS